MLYTVLLNTKTNAKGILTMPPMIRDNSLCCLCRTRANTRSFDSAESFASRDDSAPLRKTGQGYTETRATLTTA